MCSIMKVNTGLEGATCSVLHIELNGIKTSPAEESALNCLKLL